MANKDPKTRNAKTANNKIQGTDFYNNTIANSLLMPSTDDLVKDHPLEDFNAQVQLNGEKERNKSVTYSLQIQVGADKYIKIENVQSVTGLGMKRNNDQRPGSAQNYMINMPGPINFDDVTIQLVYKKSGFFLSWLADGVLQGAVTRANVEIHVSYEGKEIYVITLCDAFPSNWSLSSLDGNDSETPVYENVTLTYSYIDIYDPNQPAS